jgi:hypothetical protein
MKKTVLFMMTIGFLLTFGTPNVQAQGFFKKIKKSLSSKSSESESDSLANDSVVKPLKWDKVPVYSAKKVTLTNEDGTPMLNEDGTPVTRVFLVDQFGNKRSFEAVQEQHKKINQAITRIILKVGGGAAVGALTGLAAGKGTGAAIGAAAGAAGGLALSAKDIKEAKAQKKSLKQQEELIAKYQANFTNEGTPINASVDVAQIEGLDISEGVSMTAEALKSELSSESFNSSDDSAWTI